MVKYRIRLQDGREVHAGAQESCAIADVQLTGCVNPDTELMSGGVCTTMLELEVIDPGGTLGIGAGDVLTLFEQREETVQKGIFIAEKPEWVSTGRYRITAYDKVSKLDRELGQWLFDLPAWPYRLQTFAQMVCRQCDVQLTNTLPVNEDYQVHAFSGAGITGRQLMQWICQIGGCFCRATAEGNLEFAWYQKRDICLRPTGELFYYHNGLSCADYTTAPVEKVQLQMTDEDVGAVYPDEEGVRNTLRITGNFLLTNTEAAPLEAAARALYAHLQGNSYTPCTVVTTIHSGIVPGDIFTVEDSRGGVLTAYAMTCVQRDGKLTVSCTGSARRDSTAAINGARYAAISGKVLNLRMDIEGLKIENADARNNLAALELDVDGIRSLVSQDRTDTENIKTVCTALQQRADALELHVQSIRSDGAEKVKTGTGYTFDEEGLRISKDGQEMENLLDNTGMYIRRSGQVILQANADGVAAADVTVRNYLVIGSHARLEDYTDGADTKRTACFYLS